jgi:sulfoxide reductase heme-binding subunit YedZ
MIDTNALWYLARGSGAVSLMLLTVVVALGIGTRSGLRFAGMRPLVVASVHRSAALLAVAFLAVHISTLMFDPYAQLNLVNVILPFTSAYSPIWVGLGTLALDLMIAIVVTSLLRERLGPRVWKAVHWSAYALWPLALLHGFGSGTDRSTTWMLGIDVACVLSVLAVLVSIHPGLREETPRTDSGRDSALAPTARPTAARNRRVSR